MSAPRPRPLEGTERHAVRDDGREHSCRECRRKWGAVTVHICERCLVPLCLTCWRAHIIHSDDGRIIACTGRSFQDTQEGE